MSSPPADSSGTSTNLDRRRTTDYLDHLVTRSGLAVFLSLVFLFLWLPMGVLVLFSFSGSGTIQFPPQSWTLSHYVALFSPSSTDTAVSFPWSVVTNSLMIAVIAATVVVIFGTLSGYAINKYDLPGKQTFQSIALLPIIVPLIVTAIGLVLFFSLLDIQLGLMTTIIGHIIYTFPFGVLIITSSIARVDQNLEEAAQDLGSTNLRIFRKILLPLILPGILATWILVFTLSLNEFVITFFVSGTFLETLPTWMWDQLRFGITPLTYVVSSFTLFMAVILVFLIHRLIGIRRIRG